MVEVLHLNSVIYRLVDPTYLQFADTEANIEDLPNTFVRNRGEIVDLMTDDNFTFRPEAVDLYQYQTCLPAKD